MKYSFVTGRYESDGSISIYCRDENYQKIVIRVIGFEPYFYIDAGLIPPASELIKRIVSTKIVSLDHKPLKMLVVNKPTDVIKLRDLIRGHLEADIRFIQRFLIDLGIKNGFEVTEWIREGVCHWKALRPVEFFIDCKKAMVDIECYSKTRFPDPANPYQKVTCATFWDDRSKKYVEFVLDSKNYVEVFARRMIRHFTKEEDMINDINIYLLIIDPDVIGEWNAFDLEYLIARARHLHVPLDIDSCCVFDLLAGYGKLYKRASLRLKEVLFAEKLRDDIEPEVDYTKMYDEDRKGLIERNYMHCEGIVLLDEAKKGIIKQFWRVKQYIGLYEMSDTLHNSVIVDVELLRRYHGKYALPSKKAMSEAEKKKSKKLIGALTGAPPMSDNPPPPKAEVVEGIADFDYSKYYVTILMALNRSPEDLSGTSKTLRVVPQMGADILEERKRYDKMLLEHAPNTPEYETIKGIRNSVKYLTESIIGYFGSTDSRLYNPVLFESVTTVARAGLQHVEAVANKNGIQIKYYDTDGIFVKTPLDNAQNVLDIFNKAIEEFCADKGFEVKLGMKLDCYFDCLLFVGVKKRYAGLVIWEDGKLLEKPYVMVKGFDTVRRDSSTVTKEMQRGLLEKIVRKYTKEEIILFVKNYITDMKNGKYPLKDIAIHKTINKRWSDYKNIPDFIRGSNYSIRHLGVDIRSGDTVKMIYVKNVEGKPPTNVICFLDEDDLPKITVNWEKMIDRTVKRKVKRPFDAINVRWEDVAGKTRTVTLMEILGRGLGE